MVHGEALQLLLERQLTDEDLLYKTVIEQLHLVDLDFLKHRLEVLLHSRLVTCLFEIRNLL